MPSKNGSIFPSAYYFYYQLISTFYAALNMIRDLDQSKNKLNATETCRNKIMCKHYVSVKKMYVQNKDEQKQR